MIRIAAAGFGYAAMAFSAGLVLGTARTLMLEPRVGSLLATLAELPVMVFISWTACDFAVRKARIPARLIARAEMGTIAFAVLMTAEALVGLGLMRLSPDAYLARFTTAAGAAGLAAQIAFAVFPIAQMRR